VRALIGALERAEQGLEIGVEQESARRLHGIIKECVSLCSAISLGSPALRLALRLALSADLPQT
jgi:hypothetical protein